MSDIGRPFTPIERAKFDRETLKHSAATKRINEQGEREARKVGVRGHGAAVDRGYVVHPDDRGALPRVRGEQCWDCSAPPTSGQRRCAKCAEKHRARSRAAHAAAKASGKRWTR